MNSLEGELQSQFNDALTAFVCDFAEVILRVVGERKSLRRIANTLVCAARAIGEGLGKLGNNTSRRHNGLIDWRARACRVQRQINVAVAGVTVINILRKCLVEDIEESSTELQVLGFLDLEILEQGKVPVLAIRRAEIERRNRCPR